jgi:hypothetical protein
MEKLTCATAKQIDLVDFLVLLGYQPSKSETQITGTNPLCETSRLLLLK